MDCCDGAQGASCAVTCHTMLCILWRKRFASDCCRTKGGWLNGWLRSTLQEKTEIYVMARMDESNSSRRDEAIYRHDRKQPTCERVFLHRVQCRTQ